MYKAFKPFGRGTTLLRDLLTMVIIHSQVLGWSSKQWPRQALWSIAWPTDVAPKCGTIMCAATPIHESGGSNVKDHEKVELSSAGWWFQIFYLFDIFWFSPVLGEMIQLGWNYHLKWYEGSVARHEGCGFLFSLDGNPGGPSCTQSLMNRLQIGGCSLVFLYQSILKQEVNGGHHYWKLRNTPWSYLWSKKYGITVRSLLCPPWNKHRS